MHGYGIRRNDVSACCPFCRSKHGWNKRNGRAGDSKAKHGAKARARQAARREVNAEV